MEHIQLNLNSAPSPRGQQAVVCGVVSSGNLEVMVEAIEPNTHCVAQIATSATGFQEIWAAVLRDFAQRHAIGGLRLSINDVGATPAVVSLRLDQAVRAFQGNAS